MTDGADARATRAAATCCAASCAAPCGSGGSSSSSREPFLHKLVPVVVEAMGGAFPELKKNPEQRRGDHHEEEESFGANAGPRASSCSKKRPSDARRKTTIPAEDAFKLHDTYGFPIDLTRTWPKSAG